MQKFKILYLLCLLVMQGLLIAKPQVLKQQSEDEQFVQSFINFYEFNVAGRYAHEYHPYLLGHTAKSLDMLERALTTSGYDLAGRMVITGYEGQAVPSYYTNLNDCSGSRIRDEAIVKSNTGWAVENHNRFGLMTGFLFKTINRVDQGKSKVCEHLAPESVEIFGERMSLFQEDAFGNGYPLMLQAEEALIKKVLAKDYLGIFELLSAFWFELYRSAANSGDRQISGTQDILFTIEHARHLCRSKLPIRHYFTGGDITYPIVISKRLDVQATANAQKFVARFVQELQPVNNQPTVYVFRSFVDGVGKSTMLGNIKNWMKYGTNVHAYQSVDNSSSQGAEVFKYSDKVFIADLPAQMSHFCYKPDGFVYVDAYAAGIDAATCHELLVYVTQALPSLQAAAKKSMAEVQNIVKQGGWFAPQFHDSTHPEYAFLKNILLLKKKDNHWIPFSYNNKHYLINELNAEDIRVLCPLNLASSSGLKNAQAEQMIFTQGVRLPLPYDYFLQDFEAQLAGHGVKQVVFVDFLSMYSRSSRENVRVNYLLQQLALLDSSFDIEKSLYKNFVSNAELFDLLRKEKNQGAVMTSFAHETMIRLVLYRMMEENKSRSLEGIPVQTLTQELKQRCAALAPQVITLIEKSSFKKCAAELKSLELSCGLTKQFVNIQEFEFEKAMQFSDFMEHLCTNLIESRTLNSLWKDLGDLVEVAEPVIDGKINTIVPLRRGMPMRALYVFSPECKNEALLTGMLRMVRTSWYATLSNLLFSNTYPSGRIAIQEPFAYVPPLVFKRGLNGKIYLLQKILDPWIEEKPFIFINFNLGNCAKSNWGQFEGIPYLLDWHARQTNAGLYGFGSNITFQEYPFFDYDLSTLVAEYQRKVGTLDVMPIAWLHEKLVKFPLYLSSYQGTIKLAQDNAKKKVQEKGPKNTPQQKKKNQMLEGEVDQGGSKCQAACCNQIPARQKLFRPIIESERMGAALFVQAVATLEMWIKDPAADVVVRCGNQEDFVAALKLLETVVIPQYFCKVFVTPLFQNCESVRPLI